jgi:hypothetical protein
MMPAGAPLALPAVMRNMSLRGNQTLKYRE